VGCSTGPEESSDGTEGSSPAAERARARAARDSAGLVERYDAALAAHPALADRLGPLRAEVVRHVTAFGGAGKAAAGPSPAGSPGGSSAGSPGASPAPAAPGTEREALAGLAAAERALADRRAKALLSVPGELARLLASVAAAGAAHAYLLTEDTR
jgi:hypothetical protein